MNNYCSNMEEAKEFAEAIDFKSTHIRWLMFSFEGFAFKPVRKRTGILNLENHIEETNSLLRK